jgi:hypothetical protein
MKRVILVVLTTALLSSPMLGQLSASASVPITLRIPGSLTLSLRSMPVSVNVASGTQMTFSMPLSVEWNLDPREVPAFRVVAYFQNNQAALVEPASATAIPATHLISRWGQGEFLSFTSDATVTLFRTTILPGLRRGKKQNLLELKIADYAAASLPDGSYQGVLYLEVRHY